MTGEERRAAAEAWLEERGVEALVADGFEEAIMGFSTQFNTTTVLYDYEKCVEKLMADGLSYEEAEEFMSFNVLGAYVGKTTPSFYFPLPVE